MSDPQPLVPVYRMHQPAFISPCIIGEPCPTCAIHQHCLSGEPCRVCSLGIPYECERAYPSPPAFLIKIPAALQLVRDGAATFVHRSSALRLTYARLTHLRDISSNVNGGIMWQYTVGTRRIRIAIDLAWGIPVATSVAYEPDPESEVATGEPGSVTEQTAQPAPCLT